MDSIAEFGIGLNLGRIKEAPAAATGGSVVEVNYLVIDVY